MLLLSTSDSDLIAARAGGAAYRWANPSRLVEGELSELLTGSDVVLVRILGGYRAWPDGIDAVLASGLPTVVVSGEQAPDADLMRRSTVPAGVAVQAHSYLAQGGVDNLRQLHAFLCDTLLMTGFGFAPPAATPTWGILERPAPSSDGPTIAVLYYRAQQLAGNTAYVEALCAAIEAAGGRPLPVFCTSLRNPEAELMQLLETADAMVVTVLAAGSARPASVGAGGDDDAWDVRHLAALDVPILQGLCLTSSRSRWSDNDDGLSPLDVATQVAVPEFDGRMGTPHAMELPFLFGTLESDRAPELVGDDPANPALSDAIQRLWVSFATDGVPRATGVPEWPLYDSDTRATMILDHELAVVDDPYPASRTTWGDLRFDGADPGLEAVTPLQFEGTNPNDPLVIAAVIGWPWVLLGLAVVVALVLGVVLLVVRLVRRRSRRHRPPQPTAA